MKRSLSILYSIALLALAPAAMAQERTVKLTVRNMSCVTCPYIVKQTLASIDGVTAVRVSFPDKTAIVTFDDAKTTVAALEAATAKVGFPATRIK